MDLSIRRMRKDDLGWLYRLLSDPEVMRWLEPPYSMEQTEAFLFRAGLSENPLIYAAEEQGVPICNYGIVLAAMTGILDKVVYPND